MIDHCESRLRIYLSCASLRNMDYIGKSDPFVLLFLDPTGAVMQRRDANADTMAANLPPAMPPPSSRNPRRGTYPGRSGRWQHVGNTETITNSLNVTFSKSFEIPYFFERAQKLAVDVFDRDTLDDTDIFRHDYLGSAHVSLPAIVRAPGQKLTVPLVVRDMPTRNCGTVTFIAEEVSRVKQRVTYDNVLLTGLPSRQFASQARGPFLSISRRSTATAQSDQSDQPLIKVLRTERPATLVDQSSFRLNRVTFNYEKLCRCDDNMPLQFDIVYEKGGKDRVFASAVSSLAQCEAKGGAISFTPRTKGCFGARNKIKLHLGNRALTEDVTFMDYIIGGCEISLVIGIDMSSSNGHPHDRKSLHFMDSMDVNEYEMAIRAVGDILAAYNSDQLFPVYGFGAIPSDCEKVSQKFSLTSSPDPTCHTINEVLNYYRHTLYTVTLSGPTEFSELVRSAADHAREEASQNEQSYTILLIITDGILNDVDSTVKEIAAACRLPLSIVIIGVGGADFTDMKFIDDDKGKTRDRDIAQFVNFREYMDTPDVLRAKVLEEIPDQFLDYMKVKGIAPRPPPDD